ncbi:MAG: arylsulfatase [Planctomycetes bacterium]|nr:arylsulfatase [Planctomycetota bacterium]
MAAGAAGAALPRSSLAAGALAGRRPNIILILTDDQGYGDFSCHGNPILKTPNLDRLHDEGVRFTDFMVSPTCSPTRSALLTGRHEFRNGVTHTVTPRERLAPGAVTLAQVLRSAGYATGIFGKWHLGDQPAYWPQKRGFDEMSIHGYGGIGQGYDAPGNTYFDPVILHDGKLEKTRGYCTDVFFGRALEWIESVKGGKPFFCYITPNAPHTPLQVRPEDEARYKDAVERPNVAKFFGMIANIDDNVGRLLSKLAQWGIDRDTLVILMNDNGGTGGVRIHNAGMRGAKNTAWIGGTRAASFWRWPGTLRPDDVGALCAHIDVFRTLAGIAGARLSQAADAQAEGRSLIPLLEDPRAAWPDRRIFTHRGRWPAGEAARNKYAMASVRTSRWHLVCEGKGGRKDWQLFDVKADPAEANDLAARHPDVVKGLDAAFDAWWDSVQPQLVNEDAPKQPNTYWQLYWDQFRGPGPNGVDASDFRKRGIGTAPEAGP